MGTKPVGSPRAVVVLRGDLLYMMGTKPLGSPRAVVVLRGDLLYMMGTKPLGSPRAVVVLHGDLLYTRWVLSHLAAHGQCLYYVETYCTRDGY